MLVIGLLGGTFDPFHNGHFQLASAIHAQLKLDEIRLIPSAIPLLRTPPIATPAERLAMLELVAQDYAWLKIDDREIKRGGFSYTVDTLTTLRDEMPDVSLCFIMSADQFVQFDQWKSWEEIPKLAHVIVANRPGYSLTLNTSLQALVEQRRTCDMSALHSTSAGLIFFQEIPPVPVSATQIRERLKMGEEIGDLVPKKVAEYIKREDLYKK